MRPPEGFFASALALPHGEANLEGLFQPLEAFLHRRKGNAESLAFRLVPGGADAQPGASAGEDVERGDGFRQDAGVAIDGARHHGAELDSRGYPSHVAERAIAFEHLVVFGAVHPDLPEVVHHPDGVEAGVVRGAGNLAERAPEFGRSYGPGEVSDIESDLHGSSGENISELHEARPWNSE